MANLDQIRELINRYDRVMEELRAICGERVQRALALVRQIDTLQGELDELTGTGGVSKGDGRRCGVCGRPGHNVRGHDRWIREHPEEAKRLGIAR